MRTAALPSLLHNRPARVGAGVLLAHAGLLWLLVHGLTKPAGELIVPAEMIAQMEMPTAARAAPPAPVPAPARPATVTPQPVPAPQPALQPTPKPTPAPTPQPAPSPTAAPTPSPAPSPAPAPAAPAAPATPAPPSAAASNSAATAAPSNATAAPAGGSSTAANSGNASAAVQLPSTNADYLQNPKPAYPSSALRMGESGTSVYRVWIGPDGRPQKAELSRSSGSKALDTAAYNAVMSWRYVPGKRGGVPELMAFDVPIKWDLPN